MATATETSDGPSRTERRRQFWRRNGQQRGGRQTQTRAQETAEISSQQLNVPTARRGRASRGRNNTRGRSGSPAHSPFASRNDHSYLGRHTVNTLPPSPVLLQTETTTIQGVGYLQTQSSTTHSIHSTPFLVETSSVFTRTESTGWSSMDSSSLMEVNTPASEPPEPWPATSGAHDFFDVGAQFASESAPLPVEKESSEPTAKSGKNSGSSRPRPVIIVTSDGKVDIIEPAGAQSNTSVVEVEADGTDPLSLLASLPLDMSSAHLDWISTEDWLETIPLRVPKASTFPPMGIDHVDDELADAVQLLRIET
ncbi:hypothetical protein K491DRAFT_694004 [Lophiostoma macrostomum CBS 122681]|uniref:Uncharacterized protein n=1 Tax=Lophiostoma macrostomum CBS 122681 TaxID=1314788 RepID=A0A6A6T2D2_9PLEO|nr:hypothetical protein K491DRAFT_694004 [Lophiostoma macrostomum CBS 122681]